MEHVISSRLFFAVSLKLLAKCDGPYLVSEMPSDQNAVLVDPVTEDRIESCSNGRTVAVDRLIIYPHKENEPKLPNRLAFANRWKCAIGATKVIP